MPSNNILRLRITIYNPGMNNNNNNNQTPLMQMRDRLFQVIFMRLSIAYASVFPKTVRRILEYLILVLAFFSLFILAYTHVMFIYRPMNCLDHVADDWPRHGILRVEVTRKAKNETYILKDSYLKEAQIRQMQGYSVPHFKRDDFITKPDVESTKEKETAETTETTANEPVIPPPEVETPKSQDPVFQGLSKRTLEELDSPEFLKRNDGSKIISTMYMNPNHTSIADGDALSKTWFKVLKTLKEEEEEVVQEIQEVAFYEDVYILEYSLEYGYLRLSPKTREKLDIPVKLAILDPTVDECFGNKFTKMLMEYFLGYNNILMASIRKLAEKEENKGYIRNVVSDHYFRFVNIMNHLSYAYSALIMVVFTLSISMLLRYSHHQIFVFIVQVLRLFEFRGSTNVPTAPLLTVILALVGMEAIMSEFFSDPTTSFYVILIVWVADQYDAICCRTTVAKRHWLRFFYLYHYAFYAYDYRFSGQYSDLALFTSCCFIFHSMVFFFHHYELPAILHAVQRDAPPQQNPSEPEQVLPAQVDEDSNSNEDVPPEPSSEENQIAEGTNANEDEIQTNLDGDRNVTNPSDPNRLLASSATQVTSEVVNEKSRQKIFDNGKLSREMLKDKIVGSAKDKKLKPDDTCFQDVSSLASKDTDTTLCKPGRPFRGVGSPGVFASTSSSRFTAPIQCQNGNSRSRLLPNSAVHRAAQMSTHRDSANL